MGLNIQNGVAAAAGGGGPPAGLPSTGIMRVTRAITTIFKSPDGLSFAVRAAIATTDYVARRVGIGCIGGVSETTMKTFDTFYGVSNIVRLPNNINYFTRGLSRAEWREGGVMCTSSWFANVLFLAARVTGVTMWLQKNELISLGRIAKGLGNLPIFKEVVRFGLASTLNTLLVGAMSFIVIERAWALLSGQTHGDVAYTIFDMVNNLSEIALIAMTFTGVVSVWALALAALVVAPTGIIATLLMPSEPAPENNGGGAHGHLPGPQAAPQQGAILLPQQNVAQNLPLQVVVQPVHA